MRFQALLLFLLFPFTTLQAQTAATVIMGQVSNPSREALELVSIRDKSGSTGTRSDSNGYFLLRVAPERNLQLVFSALGYKTKTIAKRLHSGDTLKLNVILEPGSGRTFREITIKDNRRRIEAGNISFNPKLHAVSPNIVGGIEGMLKIFLGDKNEMTSQYNVRGGNYDENLVYINDFEVYRPFLVRSGQQEGLSIINPDLVGGVNFSTGGFQSKYGDKMSSVLDITYKRPKENTGSVSLSMLGFGAHLEGTGIHNRLSYLIGLRQKSNQYLLQAQQTKGVYNPSFTDIQVFLNYQFNTDWQTDVFINYARNRFDFQPENSTQSFGLINKAFQLRTFYNGAETDQFDSRYGGWSCTWSPGSKWSLKLLASGFQTNESETYDIQGEYLLGEIETDLGKENFGEIKYALGTGMIHNYARNYLKVNVFNTGHKGSYNGGRHFVQWGLNTEYVQINDQLNEWERRDSAGFTQPANDSALYMAKRFKGEQAFHFNRYSGFIQDNIAFDSLGLAFTGGIRFNYNALNREWLFSPRIQFSLKPQWKRDMVIRAASGLYMQPPFYREMRDYNGGVNLNVKAQKSLHVVGGIDYNFKALGNRPFKVTAEAYYKYLWDLVPYEYDNVRIRYSAVNNARGFAYGVEGRLFGQIVKEAESWISMGFMKTMEDIQGDQVMLKSRETGADSTLIYPGYIPRPTDSRFNFGMFFSDYLPGNKNFKLYLNGLYSTGLPFGPPDQNRAGDTLRIPSYKRVDVGFSALLLDGDRKERPRYSMFSKLKSIWASLEVFNLLGIQNTLSYLWIQDQTSGRTYAVPNRLTSRLLNAKLVISF